MQNENSNLNYLQLNQKYGFLAENTIFTVNQSYSYVINIFDKRFAEMLSAYKKKYNISKIYPMSDEERYEFENLIFKMLDKAKEKQLIPTVESYG